MVYKILLKSVDENGLLVETDITDRVDTGFNVVEKLNEELDVGNMVISFNERKTPYSIFDIIRISINDELIYSMRIGGDTVQLVSKKPLLYKHTLSLVEHTKILERVFISGKTFTQPIDGSTPLTLFDVINTLRLIYPLELNNLIDETRIFKIPSELETYLDSIESPEFTFKDITLREALNQVLTYVDGVARLNESSELQVDFFNDLVDLISEETDMLNSSRTQDNTFYATDMTIDAINVVSDDLASEAVEIYPSKDAYVTARSDDYIFDFTKSYIPTPKRIYSVSKIKMILDVVVTEDGTTVWDYSTDGYYEFDIKSDRILEYEKYKILEVTTVGTAIPDNYSQNNVLYYNYGKNNITQSATYGLSGTGEVIDNVIFISMYEQMVADGILSSSTALNLIVSTWSSSYNDYQYQVHYVSNNKSLRFNVDREDLTDINKKTTLSSNQQSRIVNLEALANNAQSKINRIGNSELTLEHRCTDVSEIKNIADYTEDLFILNQKEVTFFKGYIENKYELTRNFNRISQFIGVNSELRQWEVAEAGRSLERDLLYKEYIEIDAVEIDGDDGSNTSELLTSDGLETYLETFKASSTLEPVRTGMILSDIYINLVPLSSNGGGNNLIFNFKLESNISAGTLRDDYGTSPVQTSLEASRYVDDDGRFTSMFLWGIDKLNAPTGISPDTYLERANNYPRTTVDKISTSLFETSNSFTVYKGIRDIIGFTLQYQQISKRPSNVLIGRYLSRRNRMVTEIPPTSFKLYTYDNNIKFNRTETLNAKSGYTSVVSVIPVVSTANNYVSLSDGSLTSETSSWCLTDENGKILIAVNQDGVLHNKIIFNFVNKRTGIQTFNYIYTVELDDLSMSMGIDITPTFITYDYPTISPIIDIDLSITPTLIVTDYPIIEPSIDVNLSIIPTIFTAEYPEIEPNIDMTMSITPTYTTADYKTIYETIGISSNIDVTPSIVTHKNPKLNLNIDIEFNMLPNIILYNNPDLDLSINMVTNLTPTYETIRQPEVNASIDMSISLLPTYSVLNYEWVETVEPSVIVITNECNSTDDIGNIKVESGYECVYAETNSYQSSTNVTTTIPACTIGAKYTLCIFNKDLRVWACKDYEGESQYQETYYVCELN